MFIEAECPQIQAQRLNLTHHIDPSPSVSIITTTPAPYQDNGHHSRDTNDCPRHQTRRQSTNPPHPFLEAPWLWPEHAQGQTTKDQRIQCEQQVVPSDHIFLAMVTLSVLFLNEGRTEEEELGEAVACEAEDIEDREFGRCSGR